MGGATGRDRSHTYAARVEWTGNDGVGTRDYRSYRRDHVIRVARKPDLLGSADPTFRGDPARHNPEELLLASLSACHLLWYLHLAAVAGIVVERYEDDAEGTLVVDPDGGGRFAEVRLRPRVWISAGDPERARAIHDAAHAKCFIASSVSFPVRHEPEVLGPPRP
jgi:organic hydroperoxide reductase OsmC/OhrA